MNLKVQNGLIACLHFLKKAPAIDMVIASSLIVPNLAGSVYFDAEVFEDVLNGANAGDFFKTTC
jgi:hypothetical protein